MANLVAVDFLLVSLRTGCARPAITAGRFGQKWRLDATHVEEFLAPVTADCIRTVDAR